MKVFAPTAFRYPVNTGRDYPYGLQDIADDTLARALLDAQLVVADDPGDQTDSNKRPLNPFSASQVAAVQALVSGAGIPVPVQGGASNASADTAVLLAALARQGQIYVPFVGDVWLTSTLWLDEFTVLECSPATRLRLMPNGNCNMVASLPTKYWYQYLQGSSPAQVAAVTITWSSGLTATVSISNTVASSNGRPWVKGDYISIQPATGSSIYKRQSAFIGVFPIASVPAVGGSNTTFTIILVEQPLAAANAVYVGLRAASGIRVRNGIFDGNNSNQSGASGYLQNSIVMAHVQDCVVELPYVQGTTKYALTFAAARNFRCTGAMQTDASNDTVKVYGPAINGFIEYANGVGGDDNVSFQCYEPAVYINYQVTEGPVIDCSAARCQSVDIINGGNIAFYPPASLSASTSSIDGRAYTFDGLSAEYCGGLAAAGSGGRVRIQGDTALANYTSKCGSITIKSLSASANPGLVYLDKCVHIRQLRLEGANGTDPSWVGASFGANLCGKIDILTVVAGKYRRGQAAVLLPATAVIGQFTIERCDLRGMLTVLQVTTGCVVDTLTIENNSITSDTELNVPTISAAGTGYAAGDYVYFSGGTNNSQAATIKVLTVSAGAIVTYDIVDRGSYIAVPSGAIATTTSGAGNGATFTATWTTYALNSLFGVGGTFKTINILNNKGDAGCTSMLQIYSVLGTPVINIEGNAWDGSGAVTFNATATITLNFAANRFDNAFNGLVRFNSTATATVTGSGNALANSSIVYAAPSGSPIVNMKTFDLPVNLSLAAFANGVNNYATHAGTTNNGLCVNTGSAWKNIATGVAPT